MEKVRQRVAECRLLVERKALRVTVSCGSMLAEPGLTAEAIVGVADSRMYQRRRRTRRETPGSSAAPGLV